MIDIAMLLVQATPLGPADTVTDFSFFRLFLMADWVVMGDCGRQSHYICDVKTPRG